jgi:hypothetical protein
MKQERQFEETLSMLERRPRLLELIRLRLSFSLSPAPTRKLAKRVTNLLCSLGLSPRRKTCRAAMKD